MGFNSFITGVVFLLVIFAGCSRDDGVPVDESIAVNAPNSFARFLNPVAGLPAGDYTVIAATFNTGEADSFSVTLGFDSGEQQTFNGSWTSSEGPGVNQLSFNNPSFDFTDIDYSTYEKFINHADQVEEYVYELGIMPLSLRGYNAFWSSDKPELLASFLPNFSHLNADGTIS